MIVGRFGARVLELSQHQIAAMAASQDLPEELSFSGYVAGRPRSGVRTVPTA